ncbi:hypothetical protein PPL_07000 [Heterostelium album PN500]|uniref:Uncharacterized protein n=1 Tax=Heterostelium pallidum (strain ATCC 26659 / Pp 5 / PN500) TaxID=670386 RepID=D3BE47_HETP5|nr:hypothetical protein PPL_07000 [Heterostelium album PN500]EFA80178.1 hypothetical protein PPL_07000 [Heterostelium album PN500]|eukprot:XP_020432298.1 hypothetical protein PPL_07000 [Heterostelium album PN500]
MRLLCEVDDFSRLKRQAEANSGDVTNDYFDTIDDFRFEKEDVDDNEEYESPILNDMGYDDELLDEWIFGCPMEDELGECIACEPYLNIPRSLSEVNPFDLFGLLGHLLKTNKTLKTLTLKMAKCEYDTFRQHFEDHRVHYEDDFDEGRLLRAYRFVKDQFSNFFKNSTLQKLALVRDTVISKMAEPLFEMLKVNQSISVLSVCKNLWSNRAMSPLVNFFRQNQRIRHLDIGFVFQQRNLEKKVMVYPKVSNPKLYSALLASDVLETFVIPTEHINHTHVREYRLKTKNLKVLIASNITTKKQFRIIDDFRQSHIDIHIKN